MYMGKAGTNIEPQTVRWNVREKAEVRTTMWRFHHSTPAWKLKGCVNAMKERPLELSSLAKVTGVRFASVDLVEMAVCCIEEITAEMKKDESKDSCAASSSHSQKVDEDKASQEATPESTETSTEDQTFGSFFVLCFLALGEHCLQMLCLPGFGTHANTQNLPHFRAFPAIIWEHSPPKCRFFKANAKLPNRPSFALLHVHDGKGGIRTCLPVPLRLLNRLNNLMQL